MSPASLRRGGAVSPLAYLDSLVGANGAVRYSRGVTQTPVWVTGEALMAMEGKPLPIAAPPPPPAPAARPLRRAASLADARRLALPAPFSAPPPPRPRAPRTVRLRTQRPAALAHAAGPPRRSRSIARNQVLAGKFAGAVGVMTALALAPVGLG